jgi:ABC-type transporter Mla MlaB component
VLRIEVTTSPQNEITLSLSGDFTDEYIPCVEHALTSAKESSASISLNLQSVNLVDRAAMCFLSGMCRRQITIINCPAYVVSWMDQEFRNCP